MEYGVLEIMSRGEAVTIDVDKLSPEVLRRAALHGLKQKIADSAAGAKALVDKGDVEGTAAEVGVQLMQKTIDALVAGDWGIERAAGGVARTPVEREMIKIVRPAVKAANAAWYKTATPRERDDACLAAVGKQAEAKQDAIRRMAEQRVEAAKLERDAFAGLAVEL